MSNDSLILLISVIGIPIIGGIIRLLLDVHDMKSSGKYVNVRLERIERRLKLNGFSIPEEEK